MESADVIIVGAGLTGLTLARHLTQKGKHFIILEARDRIGGRIHSVDTAGGAVVEMGATWFFPHFKNLFKLLKEIKVELTDQYLKGHTLYESDRNTPARKVYSSGDDDMFRIKGGTSQIVETLYNNLDKSKVLLGQNVSEIRHTAEGMEVVSNGQVFRSSRVVTTVPPQLLAGSVSFSPALSQHVMTVLKNTHTWMGDSLKGAVAYKTPFWKEEGLSGALYSNVGPFVQMYDQCGSDGEGAALVGFLDDRIAHLPFEERRDKVIGQLVRVFGDQAGDFLEYTDTVWSKEQFTMDSQAVRLSRHKSNGHEVFQQPMMGGRLVIGGTETSPRAGGYMEGAVNSADNIMKMLID
eukprot:GFUD01035840.1.p1 GENE.GFUD01035840.1~~GFUD01035840.1.p1  ORF type:complete len:351 (+),score=98.86 GFUD01035840.1:105-1157(+)